MTPMPIFIPISGSESTITNNYTYPSWVVGVAKIGIAIAVLGFVALLVCLVLNMITDDDRFNVLEKPAMYTFVVCVGGIVITMVAMVLMLFTGTQITE